MKHTKCAIVTGANGFVGSYVVHALSRSNYDVWAVVRNTQSNIDNLCGENIHIIYCDLQNIKALPSKIKRRDFDCFYHLAWEGSSGSQRANYLMQMNNATASAQAVDTAKQLGCRRFVGAGSITELMYGDYLKQDGSQPDMVTCYAIGKIAAEFLCRCVAVEKGIDFVWGYLSNFYGVGDQTQNFINFLIQSYLQGQTPSLTDGKQLADFTYVSDIAKGIVLLGEKAIAGNTYYVGYGKPRALREYILDVRNSVAPNLEAGIGQKEFHGLSVDFNKINIKKLFLDTGFQPSISFNDGIALTLDWFKTGRYSPWIV